MKARMTALAPDAVFALLGTTRARARRESSQGVDPATNSYEAVDYGLNRMLLDAAVDCGSAPRFVYLSAMGAAQGRGAYMAVRRRLEGEVRASGLACTLVRPGFITGDDREESRPAERMAATLSDGVLGMLSRLGASGPARRWGSLSSSQLAAAIVRAVDSPSGQTDVLETTDLRG